MRAMNLQSAALADDAPHLLVVDDDRDTGMTQTALVHEPLPSVKPQQDALWRLFETVAGAKNS